MKLLDKLLGRKQGAAEQVRGDESPAEVQSAAQDQHAAAEPPTSSDATQAPDG
jgi:hypothetical protein